MIDLVEKYAKQKIIFKNTQFSADFISLLNGTIWSVGGSVISKGLVFFSWVFLARILGKEGYGEFGIIRNTILMFSSFGGFALGLTSTKYVAEFITIDKAKVERLIGLNILFAVFIGLLTSTVICLFSSEIANELLKAPQLKYDLYFGALALLFTSINGAQIGVLQGLNAYKRIAIINFLHSVLSFPLLIAGAYLFDVNGAIFAFAMSNIIICLLSFWGIRKECMNYDITINYKKALQERSIIYRFGFPTLLSGIMVTPIKWISDVMLINQENGFSQLGIFTAALTFNTILMMITTMLDGPFLTIMSKMKNNSESSIHKINILVTWIIGLTVTIPFLIFPEIGGRLFGEEYIGNDFKWVFLIILFYTLIPLFTQGLTRLFAVHNLQWIGLLSNILWGGMLLLAFKYLSHYGVIGLAVSYLIAYIFNTIITLWICHYKRILPTGLIISKNTFGVWIIIFLLLLSNILAIPLILKVVVLVITYFLMIVVFSKMLKLK